jgi:hypothetical protein
MRRAYVANMTPEVALLQPDGFRVRGMVGVLVWGLGRDLGCLVPT